MEMITASVRSNANPRLLAYLISAAEKKELLEEVDAYYMEAIEGGVFDPNGGGEEAALADFIFFVDAGQLEGPASDLKVEDYWYLAPLDAAKAKLGN